MSYLSFHFFVFVTACLLLYYLPDLIVRSEKWRARLQSLVLLLGSAYFYYRASDLRGIILFASTILISYGLGRGMAGLRRRGAPTFFARLLLMLSILLCASPLLLIKATPWFDRLRTSMASSLIVPVGLSFYTLQIISYLSDCFTGKTEAETNLLDYALFISFFPQIVQGPIPRHGRLSKQLKSAHRYDANQIARGFQLVLWGCFLKLMIADKVVASVNQIFNSYQSYPGFYVVIGAILYSLQLYTDFYSCVTLCQGVAGMFGIELMDNFQRPYVATSIKDFWRRWHISLSTWFRDYIYIPLGGSRKGKFRMYANLMIVFLVSGLWHGNGTHFLVWGIMHGVYQIAGRLTDSVRERAYRLFSIEKGSFCYTALKRIGNFFWVAVAWVFFRADSLKAAVAMLRNVFVDFNPWVLLGADRFSFGLDVHDWFVLIASVAVLIGVSCLQEKGVRLRERFSRQHRLVRWTVYILAIVVMWVFGSYGYGFVAADFIYGGF